MAIDYRPALAPHRRGTAVTVWVVPGASRTEIVGVHGQAIKVRVAAPPEHGRANEAVRALLEDRLGARIELLSGAGGRRKRILVEARDPDDVAAALGAAPQR